MDLDLTDDQRAILDALDSLCKPFENAPIHDAPLAAASQELDRAVVEGGFLDVALDPDLGCVTAAIVIERLSRLPFAVESAASALVRPLLGEEIGYPLCLVENARPTRPVRFLRAGATVVQVGDGVSLFTATADQVRPEPEALFAYPVATLVHGPEEYRSTGVSSAELLARWRVGLAAETAGLLAAALAATCAHLTDRQQFGRPLATFQALRHRLSEAQVRTNGVYWLAMKAAASLDPADAALAALHAQESARHCVYDFHQFLGAMGMTLEHPLHLWTYRLKLLIGELGGRNAQALAAAEASWG
ncbi:acyl-CoA dehydrogenase family protein [Parasphingorhabdus sp.]|uniref:acyl-CoA dehydrogenase family protein n=1 Tax=Parasphingorhabdus sp. TaxID=2709688 RepID=UPI003A934661